MKTKSITKKDLNRDPITGEPGSHPVGTGVGAMAGAATGAAIGSIGGPVGAAVGGTVGAIAGGFAGHGVAESIDPTLEESYWRENFRGEPYYEEPYNYADYAPAYRLGYERYPELRSRPYAETEDELGARWDEVKGESRLTWDKAKHAVRAGWHRVERSLPGDADRDGR